MSLILELRVWFLVVALSAVGTATALTFYYAGRKGTDAVFSRFPSLKQDTWERAHRLYTQYGSWVLLLSFVPGLGAILEAAAGAFDVRVSAFLILVMIGRLVRNAVIALVIDLGLSLFR